MGSFLLFVLQGLIGLLIWAIIISAVLSWLVAFDVINTRHRFVAQLMRALEAVTDPVLAPFRRFIPALGGIDLSPIVAILVLEGLRRILLPWLFGFLIPIIG